MKNKQNNEKNGVPAKFKGSIKNNELMLIKVVHKSANGTDIKEETPKHAGRKGPEVFLQTASVH